MSGIVGIVNTGGAPVSRNLLAAMTEFQRFRGPDSQNLWCDSEVGFGHALLDTTGGSAADQQPCSIDGKVWIVADARVDGRAEMCEKLRSAGIPEPRRRSDAELILLAYQAWGKDCLHHLLGDFAFAIWDATRKQLFCARDHFGVKPFYYANSADSFVFSNTLHCLRLHPNVSSRLNDSAIADYLLFGSNQEPRTTSFEQIQRLAPAHWLLCAGGKVNISKYWTLQQSSELHYTKREDYVEHFRSLLGNAVRDRLPGGPVAVCMSGGLDSSTIAAAARRELGEDRKKCLQAHSVVYDRLIPDQERRFASRVAEFCDVDLHFLVADDYQLFQHWKDDDSEPAEPFDLPLRAAEQDLYARLAAHSRVVLTGEGGDPGLVGSPEAIVRLLRTGKLWNLAAGYVRCALWQRSVPRVGLRSLFRSGIRAEENTSVPEWINPQLASKLDLPRRASQLEEEENVLPSNHPRPKAYKILAKAEWANTFELYDPGNSPRPVEARHPFFDVRLLEFLLSLPTLPWCVGKQMIREGMAGFLPKEVLRRRKAPLAGDPVIELLKQPQSAWVESFQPTSEVLHYVNPSRIPSIVGRRNFSSNSWLHLRPLILDHWLQMQVRVGYKDRV